MTFPWTHQRIKVAKQSVSWKSKERGKNYGWSNFTFHPLVRSLHDNSAELLKSECRLCKSEKIMKGCDLRRGFQHFHGLYLQEPYQVLIAKSQEKLPQVSSKGKGKVSFWNMSRVFVWKRPSSGQEKIGRDILPCRGWGKVVFAQFQLL